MAYESPGNNYGGTVYRDGIRAIVNTAVTGTLAPGAAVAAGTESSGDAVDKNVLALTGVVPMGAGDGLEVTFAKSGTITGGTLLVSAFRPIFGATGKIVGYAEFVMCDVGASLTYGAIAIGAGFAGTGANSIGLVNGTAPATLPAGTEVWAKALTISVGGTAISASTVLNNMDLLKTTDDSPCTLRITPAGGVSHIRIQQSTGGGGGTMWAFPVRTRGGSLNSPRS